MKPIFVALLGASLAGCAHAPMPMVSQPLPHHKLVAKPVVVPPVAAPVVPATPNQAVKKRWYDHFPKHPKFFHSK